MEIFDTEMLMLMNDAMKRAASLYETTELEPEHVVLVILKEEGLVPNILYRAGYSVSFLKDSIEKICESNSNKLNGNIIYSPTLNKVIEKAKKEKDSEFITALDFFIATVKLKTNVKKVYQTEGITVKKIRAANKDIQDNLQEQMNQSSYYIDYYGETDQMDYDPYDYYPEPNMPSQSKQNNTSDEILKYATNLSELHKKNKLQKAYGRTEEIELCLEALSKKQKRNLLILGDPGVGKTAIVEGLVAKLPHRTVYSFDIHRITSGTKYRGDIEKRIEYLVDYLKNNDVIGFFDEAHSLKTGVGNEDGVSLLNALKPAMARNEVQVILATTHAEYNKFLEYDKALARRCSVIKVKETDEPTTKIILNKFAKKHNIKISSENMDYLYSNAKKYISGRYMPDLGIELLDNCYAKLIRNGENNYNAVITQKLNKIEEDKFRIVQEGAYDQVIGLKQNELELLNIQKVNEKRPVKPLKVTQKLIDDVFMKGYRVHIAKDLTYNNYVNDLNFFTSEIIGQADQLKTILERYMVGQYSNRNKPTSFFLLGPTGVGKSKTVKEFSKKYFNNSFLKIDCGEYQAPHSIDNLIGSPVGYVGNEKGGLLTNHLIDNPYTVVLFDEIEKAHPNMFNLLLSLLDEGILKDKRGNTTVAKNAVIFFTSNVGYSKLNTPIGFDTKPFDNTKDIELKFKKEFINRLDEVIYYNYLDVKTYTEFLNKLIKETREKYEDIKIIFSSEFKENIIHNAFEKGYGIRYLENIFDRDVIKKIVFAKMKDQKTVKI